MFSRPSCAKAFVSSDGKTKFINKKANNNSISSTPEISDAHENYTNVFPSPNLPDFNTNAAANDKYYINYLKYEMQNFMEIGLTDSEDDEDIDAEIKYLMQGGSVSAPIDIAQYHEYLNEKMNSELLTEDPATTNKEDLKLNIQQSDISTSPVIFDRNSADSSINNQFDDSSNNHGVVTENATNNATNPLTAELMADIKREIERVMNGDFDMEAGSEYGAEMTIGGKNSENPKIEETVKEPEAIERFYIKSDLNPCALPFELPTSHDLKMIAEAEARARPSKNKKKQKMEKRAFCFDTYTNDPATLVKNHGNPYSREYVKKN